MFGHKYRFIFNSLKLSYSTTLSLGSIIAGNYRFKQSKEADVGSNNRRNNINQIGLNNRGRNYRTNKSKCHVGNLCSLEEYCLRKNRNL